MAGKSSAQRIGVATAAAAIVFQLSGCVTSPVEDEYPLPNREVAKIDRGFNWVQGRAKRLDYLIIDGKSQITRDAPLTPGATVVGVPVEWSNGFKDQTRLPFDAQPGKSYVALIYELERGEDSASVEIRRKTFGEELLEGGIGCAPSGTGCVLLFLLALPFMTFELSKGPPTARPFEGCCFVWVQDLASGQVVAGLSPKSGSN